MIRKILLCVAPVALTACAPSFYSPSQGSTSYSQSGYYASQAGCYDPCQSTGSYAPSHDNATAWHIGHSAPAQMPAYRGTVTEIFPGGAGFAAPVETAYDTYAYNTAPHAQAALVPALRPRKPYSVYGNIGGGALAAGDDIYGVVGRLGVESGFFGAEIEGATGVNKKTRDAAFSNGGAGPVAGELDVGVDYIVAAYGVGRINVLRGTNAFVRAGYHATKISATGRPDGLPERSGSETVDGFAIGTGFEVNLDEKNALRFDATGYEIQDDAWSRAYTASYTRRF